MRAKNERAEGRERVERAARAAKDCVRDVAVRGAGIRRSAVDRDDLYPLHVGVQKAHDVVDNHKPFRIIAVSQPTSRNPQPYLIVPEYTRR